MREFHAALSLASEPDLRTAVLDDLASYFKLDAAECLRLCRDWESMAEEEWAQQGSATAFWRTTMATAFDVLWHAYLQAEGYVYPMSVVIANRLPAGRLPPGQPGMRHLDFGAGAGVTSQLFARLGFATELADISTSLLSFARYRLTRRGVSAHYIDLNSESLESEQYDVITALYTLVHVPDIAATARLLHRALKPDGVLFANFDVREPGDQPWFLYHDDLPLRWELQRAGFEPEDRFDHRMIRYRKVDPVGLAHRARGLRDAALLRGPLRPAYRQVRHSLVPRLRRAVRP